MINISELPLNKQFSRRPVRPDTWIINCYSESSESPNPHVLVGEESVLVIDTTDTKLDLRGYIEKFISHKPVMVASTHSHGDHTLGNGKFSDRPIYMSEKAWEEIREKGDDYGPRGEGHIVGNYTPRLVKPGDIIDLGNRQVEVIDFGGCHSGSSIAYLDRKYGIFFPGDEMESGQVLMQGEDRGGRNSVELYRDNLLKLKERSGEFDMICPAHNGTPLHAIAIDYFIENCERIMSGMEGEKDIASMTYLLNPHESRPPERVRKLRFDPASRRSEWMGTSIVYSMNRVFKQE